MLISCCRATVCLALLAALSGCSSLFAPRPNRLMRTTRELTKSSTLPVALPRELQKQNLPEYRVAPGDIVLAEPIDFNSSVRLPAEQKIKPDGTIDLGQYGRLVVTGMSLDEIRDAVERKIAEKEEKNEPIHIQLTEPESQVYYVVGEVNSPASYPIIGRETVLDAVLAAGGLSAQADRHNLILSRPTSPASCRAVLPICFRHIVELGDSSTNYQVMPGDRIYVPSVTFSQQLFRFFAPTYGERCPKCAPLQTPCYADVVSAVKEPIGELVDSSDAQKEDPSARLARRRVLRRERYGRLIRVRRSGA